MFLIFGSDSLAIRLAEWIGARSRVRIIGLAEQLVPMNDVEIVLFNRREQTNSPRRFSAIIRHHGFREVAG